MPNTATITFSPASSRFTSSPSRRMRRQLVAARPRAAHVDRQPQRVVAGTPARPASRSSSTSSPGSARTAVARWRPSPRSSRPAARAPRVAASRRAASSEPSSSELGLVDSTSVTARSTTSSSIRSPAPRWTIADWVRLPDDLVRARDHQVGAERQRVRRQVLVEGQVRAPRLVDHQRHAVGVRHLGQPGHVGHRAEVGRRDRGGADRVGGLGQRPVERLGREAVGDAELGIELGGHEARAHARSGPARRSCSSGRCAGPRPRRRRGGASAGATWLPCEAPLIRNHVRRAPHASAASSCAAWNGVGSGPTSMPQVSAGTSSASARSPIASRSSGSAPGPPLWPGHVQPRGVACGVCAQGLEEGGPGGGHGASLGLRRQRSATASAGEEASTTPSISQVPSPATGLPARRANAISDSVPVAALHRDHRVRRPAPPARCAPRPGPVATATSTHGFAAARSSPGRIPSVVPPSALAPATGRLHRAAHPAADQHGARSRQLAPDLLGRLGLAVRGPDDCDVRRSQRTTKFTSLPGTTTVLTISRAVQPRSQPLGAARVLLQLLARGAGRHHQPVDQLAVQLHDQLDLVGGQQRGVGLRPGLLPHALAGHPLVDLASPGGARTGTPARRRWPAAKRTCEGSDLVAQRGRGR